MSELRFNPYIAPFKREEAYAAAEDDWLQTSGDTPLYRLQNNENPLGPSPLVVEAITAWRRR